MDSAAQGRGAAARESPGAQGASACLVIRRGGAFNHQAHRATQVPFRLEQRRLRLFATETLQEQKSELHASIGLLKRVMNFRLATASQTREDLLASANKFSVRRLHIDHQAVIDPPEEDHDERRQQDQRDPPRAGL
jgi:hypothetical protein